jgi:hypothetical protein
MRAYHLPGNSWSEDWFQYFSNNHPLFGICCHHPLHPITFRMRIVNLFGSIVVGLAVTNIIWLWFIFSDEYDSNTTVLTISLGGINTDVYNTTSSGRSSSQNSNDQINITEGMILLWTVGGIFHAVFDVTVWFMTACVCCLPGQRLERFYKYKWCGNYFVVLAVVACTAIATLSVLVRASLATEASVNSDVNVTGVDSAGLVDDNIQLDPANDSKEAFKYLLSYAVELALALLVYYPIVGTIFFSGILGCGKVPILGGRPYEMAQEQKLRDDPSGLPR